MCDQDQDQPFIAPGFDANLHSCSTCNDTGISQETAGYCTACRMGKRIEKLDQFAEQLKGHGFTEAMRIVYRTTQRTEKAIAAADKALMMARIAKLENQQQWISVKDRLPSPEVLVMVYVPENKHEEAHITFDYIDPNDDDHASWYGHNEHYEHFCCVAKPEGSIGPSADAPYTHWMPLPASPVSKQG